EAERCDAVAYLYRGRVRVQGTPQEVKAGFPRQGYRLLGDLGPALAPDLRRASWAQKVRVVGETVTVETPLSGPEVRAALRDLHADGISIEPVMPTLEMVFTELTEQAERELRPA
ncbi:MAG TPA: hypothetical protein VKJ47_23785, partial [Candidatus Binatia bacterium]|nr:hypothetical protein [Candidatus Binatia bacterium]